MQKLFSIINENSDIYLPCIAKRVIPDWIEQEIITERISELIFSTPQENASIDRYLYLKNNPWAWYLDADIIVQKWPDFEMESGHPYLAVAGNPDTWAIMGNGCTWLFDYLIDFYKNRGTNTGRIYAREPFLSPEIAREIRPIPQGYFLHLSFSKRKWLFK